MFYSAYSLGYDSGRSDERRGNHNREVVHQILTGERPVTVDQSYIDQLHAALAEARSASAHNFAASNRLYEEGADWKQKAQQFRDEALYWRDQKYTPLRAKAKARREENAALQTENARLREENAVLLARLQQRNPTLAAEQAAHDETFKEKQSLQRFRVVATSLIDALLAGRAARPEFAELLNLTKAAVDAIERGDRTVFRDEPEKSRVCDLAESLQKP
jgi:hypothetical protein